MKRIDNRQRKNVLVKRDYQKAHLQPSLTHPRSKKSERDRRQDRRFKT